MDPTAQIIVLVILLLLSAFFSSAETALTTVSKLRIRSLVEEGKRSAKPVAKLIEDPAKMISAILIGNNIVNLSASSIATSLALKEFSHSSYSSGIATIILTIVILIFGEITPKTLATVYNERLSFLYAPAILTITRILTPVIFLLNKFSELLMKPFGIDPSKKETQITENELLTIVDVSHEEGVIESDEREMINNVVDFGDSMAKEVMIPKVDVDFAEDTFDYDMLLEAFAKNMYSRLPVFHETRDNVIGIINLKDLFFYRGKKEDFHLADFLREPFFTYDYKKTSELLNEMRRDSIPMAIVRNEYGSTVGLVTLEDLIEEIVGEIRDEYDKDEVDVVQKIGENEYIAEGVAHLDEVNEAVGLSLASDDYDSIAGHVIFLLDHLPEEGESLTEKGVTYTVEKIDKNRIDKVHILVDPNYKEEENEEEEQ